MSLTGKFTDTRDGKRYKVVKLPDGNWWFAENLAWDGAGVDYNNDPANRAIYGRLYTFDEAQTSIPPYSRMPPQTDFTNLFSSVGGDYKSLQVTSWASGTDLYGFHGLPAGDWWAFNSTFNSLGANGYLWSSTEGSPTYLNGVAFYFGSSPIGQRNKADKVSVRPIITDPSKITIDGTPTLFPKSQVHTGVLLATVKTTSPVTVYYTLDGSLPTTSSPVYNGDIRVTRSCTVAVATYAENTLIASDSASYTVTGADIAPIPSYSDAILPLLLQQYKGDNA